MLKWYFSRVLILFAKNLKSSGWIFIWKNAENESKRICCSEQENSLKDLCTCQTATRTKAIGCTGMDSKWPVVCTPELWPNQRLWPDVEIAFYSSSPTQYTKVFYSRGRSKFGQMFSADWTVWVHADLKAFFFVFCVSTWKDVRSHFYHLKWAFSQRHLQEFFSR